MSRINRELQVLKRMDLNQCQTIAKTDHLEEWPKPI
jgi:hypothetical protein